MLRSRVMPAIVFSILEVSRLRAQEPVASQIDRVLRGLRQPIAIKHAPPVRWTLSERMATLRVPGVSIAIIDRGEVIWAGGFGVKERGTTDLVTPATLFQAQSISKPVTATALLRLVDAGQLSLEEDVNRYLEAWKVPENRFTKQEQVTLRRIVSHSAGFTVGGFPGYRLGDSLPTLAQILNGEKPANTPPVRVDTFPGAISRYSGGGYQVLQQVLIDLTGEPFLALMKRLVLDPAGMTLSTFEQPLPDRRRREAASGHTADGTVMTGRWPIHPEMAAAGLWTMPTELAAWAIEIAKAWSGRRSNLLSTKLALEMLTVQKATFGLGLALEGKDRSFGFGHSGANLGFRAEFVMYPALGKGAVVMTNADLGGYLIEEVFQSIAAEFSWPAHRQSERDVVTLMPGQLDGVVGLYTMPGPFGALFPTKSRAKVINCSPSSTDSRRGPRSSPRAPTHSSRRLATRSSSLGTARVGR